MDGNVATHLRPLSICRDPTSNVKIVLFSWQIPGFLGLETMIGVKWGCLLHGTGFLLGVTKMFSNWSW